MKKVIVVALALTLLASASFAAVTGGRHDLSGAAWNNGANGTDAEICIVCHTPHNSLQAVPLWNRADGATTSFAPYSSSVVAAVAPGAGSLMCLSCHDGVTGLDSFAGTTGATANPIAPAVAGNFGTDLSNDHPIGINYTAGTKLNATTDNISATLTIGEVLVGGKVECSSCHDVHAGNIDGTDPRFMLRSTNANSALCTACHRK
jgi:hypothetical protein